jgi:hypothetical protein
MMSEHSGQGVSLSRTAFELKRIWQAQSRLCGICRFVTATIEQDIDSLFYENVNDPPTRDAIRQAGGFCRYHAATISRQADALGTAIILRDVLNTELKRIDGGEFDRPSAGSPLTRLFDRGREAGWEQEMKCRPCPYCDRECEVTELAIDALLDGLADPEFAAIVAASEGLCVAHFHLAFARRGEHRYWEKVVAAQKNALRRLTAELAELARKHDYRFRDEPRGEEMTSWRRALNASSSWVEK